MLTKPLSKDEVKKLRDEEGYISVNVPFDLNEIIDHDLEGFNDLAEERILEHGILADISYKVVGHQVPEDQGSGTVIVQVTAEVVFSDEE